MANLHGQPDTLKEIQAIGGDLLPACLLTSPGVTAPGSGLTIAAASCTAYARSATDLVYIDQPAVSVTVPNVAGSHWLIAHRDTYSAVASWTRRAGSHFLTQQAATQPTIPDGAVLVAQLTVAGGNITAVDTGPALSPPLSRQTADAVDITGGRISIGGHAPTGVLDVQGSVVASDLANQYLSARLWPTAPAAATGTFGLRVEATTGAGLATTAFRGYAVLDQPGMASAYAFHSLLSAGTGRYSIASLGTAQSYFAGNVGIGGAGANPPAYPLDVAGSARVSVTLAVGGAAVVGNGRLEVGYNRATVSGITVKPDADTGGGFACGFFNAAGAFVGSISTTGGATAFNTSSDGRLKEAVQPLVDALSVVRQLAPIGFRWKADGRAGHGFVAEHVQAVLPEVVTGTPGAVDAQGQIVPQQMDMSKLLPWVVGALQEVLVRLEALEAHA